MIKLPMTAKLVDPRDVVKIVNDMNTFFLDFDRVFDRFDKAVPTTFRSATYPPLDIVEVDDGYEFIMAVAGYSREDLSVEVDTDHVLTVTGKVGEKDGKTYLARGISARAFVRKWQLLDTDKVTSATLENGMLVVKVTREPVKEKQVFAVDIK